MSDSPYEIVEALGHQGAFELFRAKRKGAVGFEKMVLLEHLRPECRDPSLVMALSEATRKTVRLSHTNISRIVDVFRPNDRPIEIALELVNGVRLSDVLSAARQAQVAVPVAFAVYVAIEVTKGLEYAHRQQDTSGGEVVHGMLSPSAIWLSFDGGVKVSDFGIPAALSPFEYIPVLHQWFREQQAYRASGAPGARRGARADLASLGAVLNEMLALAGTGPIERSTQLASPASLDGLRGLVNRLLRLSKDEALSAGRVHEMLLGFDYESGEHWGASAASRWLQQWAVETFPPCRARGSAESPHRAAEAPSEASGNGVPFVGRRAEMQALYERMVKSGSPRSPLFITGPAGIGKSRLIGEMIRRCRHRVSEIEFTKVSCGALSRPGDVLVDLVKSLGAPGGSACAPAPPSERPSGLKRRFEAMARSARALERLPELFADEPRGSIDPIVRLIEELLSISSGDSNPFTRAVVFDDADRMDSLTVRVIEALARTLPFGQNKTAFVFIGREASELPAWEWAERFELAPLSEEETARFVSVMVEEPVLDAESFGAFYTETAGNPSAVEAFIGYWAEGSISAAANRARLRHLVRRGISPLLESRFQRLNQVEQNYLGALAQYPASEADPCSTDALRALAGSGWIKLDEDLVSFRSRIVSDFVAERARRA